MSEKIADKIRKLLALAKSPNEAEAMAAMDKAQELMAAYGVSVDTVETEGQAGDADPVVSEEFDPNGTPTWKGLLLVGLGEAYSCEVYKSGKTYVVIGKPHRVAILKSFFEYLTATVDRTAKEARQRAQNDPYAEPNMYVNYSWRKWGTDFRTAMAGRISQRLKEKARQLRQTTTAATGSALVVQDLHNSLMRENQQFLAKQGISLRAGRTSRTRDTSASAAGRAAGDRTGLSGQMRGGASRRALSGH